MWSLIARAIASTPVLKRAVVSYAMNRPYFDIYNEDGALYMRRWWLLPKFALGKDENGNPFPKKWVSWFAPRLHHIVRPDEDRHLHDHPFNYRTMIIEGWYLEEDIWGSVKLCDTGSTRTGTAQTFHKINEISDGGVWTIFITKRRVHDWGFLVDGRKVHWKEYITNKFKYN